MPTPMVMAASIRFHEIGGVLECGARREMDSGHVGFWQAPNPPESPPMRDVADQPGSRPRARCPFDEFMAAALYDPSGGLLRRQRLALREGRRLPHQSRGQPDVRGDPGRLRPCRSRAHGSVRHRPDSWRQGPVPVRCCGRCSTTSARRRHLGGGEVPCRQGFARRPGPRGARRRTIWVDPARRRGVILANELLDNLPAALVVRCPRRDGPSSRSEWWMEMLALVQMPRPGQAVADWADAYAGDAPRGEQGGGAGRGLRLGGGCARATGRRGAGGHRLRRHCRRPAAPSRRRNPPHLSRAPSGTRSSAGTRGNGHHDGRQLHGDDGGRRPGPAPRYPSIVRTTSSTIWGWGIGSPGCAIVNWSWPGRATRWPG